MLIKRLRTCAIPALLAVFACGLFTASAAEPAKTQTVEAGAISLTVPGAWKQKAPRNKFRLAQFDVPKVNGDSDDGEFVVFYFQGAGGSTGDNVRRWVNQFRSKGRTVKMTSGKSPQGEYVLVDLSGTWLKPIGPPIRQQHVETPNSRALNVILTVKDQGNYFLRLTGPEKTVSANANALRAAFAADAKSEKEYKLPEE